MRRSNIGLHLTPARFEFNSRCVSFAVLRLIGVSGASAGAGEARR
jgi:hypothetical protein